MKDYNLSEEVRKVLQDPGLGDTWQHAILEIFEPKAGWPKEGAPADWVYEHRVLFGDGTVEDVVVFCPLWKILFWKARNVAIDIYWWAHYYAWDWWHPNQWEDFKKKHGIKVVDDEVSSAGH